MNGNNENTNKEDFLLLKQFLSVSYGISLSDIHQPFITVKLNKLCENNGISHLHELVKRMQQSHESGLRTAVIEAVTINETSWCRDQYPFEILKKIILPEIHRKHPMDALRIWSAACSYGQEPYSISMVIDDVKKMHPTHFVAGTHILATDISEQALAEARRGEYEAVTMSRGLPQEWRHHFFDERQNQRWAVKDSIKNPIEFSYFNLIDSYDNLGKFDVIFCRNVLVYFSKETKLDILRRMHAILKPGGYLMVGAMEVLSGVQDYYQIMQCNPGIIYRAIEKR